MYLKEYYYYTVTRKICCVKSVKVPVAELPSATGRWGYKKRYRNNPIKHNKIIRNFLLSPAGTL